MVELVCTTLWTVIIIDLMNICRYTPLWEGVSTIHMQMLIILLHTLVHMHMCFKNITNGKKKKTIPINHYASKYLTRAINCTFFISCPHPPHVLNSERSEVLYSGSAEIVWLLWLLFASTLKHRPPWWTSLLISFQRKQLSNTDFYFVEHS